MQIKNDAQKEPNAQFEGNAQLTDNAQSEGNAPSAGNAQTENGPQSAKITRPTHSFLLKTVAAAVFTLLTLCTAFGLAGAGIVFVDQHDGRTSAMESSLVTGQMRGYNNLAAESYRTAYDAQTGAVDADVLTKALNDFTGATNYRFVITDAEGQVLASNIGGQNVQKAGDSHRFIRSGQDDLFVQGYFVDPPVVQDEIAASLALSTFLFERQNQLLISGIVCAVMALFLLIFLLCAAGRHRDSEKPRRGWIDRIPFDLLLLVTPGVLALAVLPLSLGINDVSLWRLFLAVECAALAANILWALMLCMTFATRIKTHTFLRSNLCVQIVLFFWRCLRGFCRWIRGLFHDLPLLWKGIVGFFGIGLFLLLTYTAARSGSAMGALLCLAGIVALFVLLTAVLRQMDVLKKGGAALAKGDFSYKIDSARMLKEFKNHAEHLNSIADGMNLAVNERMRSERMKTDLITNVSHDLKTPLTSIVSYVDLLKKEELHNDTAAGYVAVLDRQAARLKKLTEDLVEASKASSGALKVTLTPTDVMEILRQSLAEYGDRLTQAGLTPILTRRRGTVSMRAGTVSTVAAGAPIEGGEPILVQADGRLLWRVFDNLLNNAVKYALPGTRVYLDVMDDGCAVAVAFKNVSREPLNIPAAELTERFVRGDASRNSEGSGLGLSIARSLTELQGAAFFLEISGDLFTATVVLPLDCAVRAGDAGRRIAQTTFGGEQKVDEKTHCADSLYATNLLTQAEKTEESIEAAKVNVDENEK